MISFAYPMMFLLIFLPFLFFELLPKVKGLHGDAIKIPFINDIKSIQATVSSKILPRLSQKVVRTLKSLYLFILWILLVCAVARPQYVGEPVRLKTNSRDIMLVIDISTSMLNPDFRTQRGRIDRLSAVKNVVSNFIDKRVDDRLGLILFGTRAYMQAPLTFDKQSIKDILLNTDAGMAGNSTAIGDALGLALKKLRDEENKENKVIILLTDGVNNDGSLSMAEVIDLAEKENFKIYTIGVGTDAGFFGSIFNINNNELDEQSLTALAERTKGNYFRAKDLDSLKKVYEAIDTLEPKTNDDNTIQEKQELFYIPLVFALFLSLFLIFLPRSYLK